MYRGDTQAEHLLLKLDFKNASNYLRQDRMLKVVRESTSDFYLVSLCEALFPYLWRHSLEGVQQGDPLGPLLLCLTTPLLIINS